mgnify:CR=1 FL=1
MRIYIVKEDYINYLKKFDDNIRDNKNESRPYIGILLEVNGMNYIAPLASPKEKHKSMKNNIDFFKLENGDLGVINLNNMIPVHKENIVEYNFEERHNRKYSILLTKQIRFINKNEDVIKNKANKLYNKVISGRSFIAKRCVNFELIEKKALEYNLIPILCCGETLEQREKGITIDFIRTQIKSAFYGISSERCFKKS